MLVNTTHAKSRCAKRDRDRDNNRSEKEGERKSWERETNISSHACMREGSGQRKERTLTEVANTGCVRNRLLATMPSQDE